MYVCGCESVYVCVPAQAKRLHLVVAVEEAAEAVISADAACKEVEKEGDRGGGNALPPAISEMPLLPMPFSVDVTEYKTKNLQGGNGWQRAKPKTKSTITTTNFVFCLCTTPSTTDLVAFCTQNKVHMHTKVPTSNSNASKQMRIAHACMLALRCAAVYLLASCADSCFSCFSCFCF